MFGVDDVSGGAGVLHHVAPSLVGDAVGAADGPGQPTAPCDHVHGPRRTAVRLAPQAAGDAARQAGQRVDKARLAVAAPDVFAARCGWKQTATLSLKLRLTPNSKISHGNEIVLKIHFMKYKILAIY